MGNQTPSTAELIDRVNQVPPEQRLAFDNKLGSIKQLEELPESESLERLIDRDRTDLYIALEQAGY